MQRRKFLQSTLLSLGALSAAGKGKHLMKPALSWKITMLNDSIGIFTESGGTIGFHLSSEGITVVDAQFPDSAPHLLDELKKKNSPLRLLINTHHHGDHTSGNIVFKPYIKRVVAHKNSLINQQRVAQRQHNLERQYLPNETFEDTWSEKAGDETIRMHYYGPGHTNGDAIVYFENSRIAHVGDLVFNRRFPFIDRTAGASVSNWIQILQKAQSVYPDDTTFICGHSGDGFPVTGKKEMLLAFQHYLTNAMEFVGQSIRSGKSKDQILTARTIPGSPEWKGDGIERTLTAVYEELRENE